MIIKKIAISLIVFIIALGGILGGCGNDPGKTEDNALSAAWAQDVVNNLKETQPVEIPGHLTVNNGAKAGGEFDVNAYFPVLTHLSMEKGYRLDYVYSCDGSGGLPLLYARQEGQTPYYNFGEYAEAATAVTRPETDLSLVWLVNDKVDGFGSKIEVDNSNEGYFEYTVLQIIGSQFYLFWHANYNDAQIVCEEAELESVLTGIDESGFQTIDEAFKKSARGIDLQPVVEMTDSLATVKLVVFTKWGGFLRYTFTIERGAGHSVTGFEKEDLLKYDCGMVF